MNIMKAVKLMKILLHSDKMEQIEKSGVGRAIKHQMKALELNDVPYTLDPKDDYDIIHINTIFPESYLMGKKLKKMVKKLFFMPILRKKILEILLFFRIKLHLYLKHG